MQALTKSRIDLVLGACEDLGELGWLLDEMAKHGGNDELLLATLLLDAIAHDDAARVAFLLDRGVSPNAPLGKVPPLDVAHRIGAGAAAEVLVGRGAQAKRFSSLMRREDSGEDDG